MGQHELPGNPPVSLTLRRSARARRLSLRVSGIDGSVTLTVPRGVSEREALGFARDKGDWLRRTLQRQDPATEVGLGTLLPVEGVARRLVPGTGRAVTLAPDTLHVPGAPETAPARVQAWLRQLARSRLVAASEGHAESLGLRFSRITLRDTRSRWGSCTADGALMYSWRLIMAPPEVLDYVAAHEVAHLAEMNHSPAFWAVVHRLYGDHRAARGWLRAHGNALHRYRFE